MHTINICQDSIDKIATAMANNSSCVSILKKKKAIMLFASASWLDDATIVQTRCCTIETIATGHHRMVFDTPHPDGDKYVVLTWAEENISTRDVPKISVDEGTRTANWFEFKVTQDDNGWGADVYDAKYRHIAIDFETTYVDSAVTYCEGMIINECDCEDLQNQINTLSDQLWDTTCCDELQTQINTINTTIANLTDNDNQTLSFNPTTWVLSISWWNSELIIPPCPTFTNLATPVITVAGTATLNQTIVTDVYRYVVENFNCQKKDVQDFYIRLRVQATNATGRAYIQVPSFAGYRPPQIKSEGNYRYSWNPNADDTTPAGAKPGALPDAPVMNKELTERSSTQRVYIGQYNNKDQAGNYYVMLHIKYIRA